MTDESEVEKAARAIESKGGLRPRQGAHTWFITQNNPTEQIPECAGMTPEQVVRWAVDHCVRNAEHGLRKSRGVGVCYERGETEHTDHIHVVLTFTGRNGGRAETVYRLWPKADIEVAKGTLEDIHDYLCKAGRFAGKGETVVSPVYEGEPLVANPRKNEKNPPDPSDLSKRDLRWNALMEAVDRGKTEEDIWSDDTLALYAKDFAVPLRRLLAARFGGHPRRRDVNVIWVSSDFVRGDEAPSQVEQMEIAVRDWLNDSGLRWAEWVLWSRSQFHVKPDTQVVLLTTSDLNGFAGEVRSDVFRIMSGAPMQVASGFDRSFWATWETVVVVTRQFPAGSMGRLINRKVAIPPNWGVPEMKRLLAASPDDLMTVEEVADMFDATLIKPIEAGDADD